MGVIWIIASVLWVVLAIVGLFYGLAFLERMQTDLGNNLELVIESLDSVHSIVDESTDVISSTHQSLETVQSTMDDASTALNDLRPLLWRTRRVVTDDIPEALDGVQESMPSLIATANSVDETLTWLSNFGFTIPNPFGTDWSYDLGINYAPEVPLDQALDTIHGNMEGLPEDLRKMKGNLNTADDNLVTVSDDLARLADDLDEINQEIADINPQLDLLAANIESIQDSFREIQDGIPGAITTARRVMIIVFGLIVFTQIPVLYLGWILVSGELLPPSSLDEGEFPEIT
jgi:prefoldin subunit 5